MIFKRIFTRNSNRKKHFIYLFQEPKISDFSPKNGIESGDTTITIKGSDIGFEGQNRYKISFYDDTFPIECRYSNMYGADSLLQFG